MTKIALVFSILACFVFANSAVAESPRSCSQLIDDLCDDFTSLQGNPESQKQRLSNIVGCCCRQNRSELEQLLRSEKLDPEARASGYHALADMDHQRQAYEQEISDFTNAIKISHSNMQLKAVSFAGRGIIYAGLGERDKGLSDIKQALKLDPNSAFANAAMAVVTAPKKDRELKSKETTPEDDFAKAEKLFGSMKDIARAAPAPKPEPTPLSRSSSACRIPLDPRGHIIVPIKFSPNGKDHLFMLDTGATTTLIAKEAFDQIKTETAVEFVGKARGRTADGSIHVVQRYRVKNMCLCGIPLGDQICDVFEQKTPHIVSLLGVTSLRRIAITTNADRTVTLSLMDGK
jgi:tetratricopeptide (TPR) repeat protein